MGQAEPVVDGCCRRAIDRCRRRRVTASDAILRRLRPTQFREIILLLVIVGLVVFFATQIDELPHPRTSTGITTTLPIVAVVAVGQVLVVLTRNIDLSVGSQVGLVAYALGTLMLTSATRRFIQDAFRSSAGPLLAIGAPGRRAGRDQRR